MQYNILIIGGGPGGCYAASLAADKGLTSVLVEETDKLGGQIVKFYPHKEVLDYPTYRSIRAEDISNKLAEIVLSNNKIKVLFNTCIKEIDKNNNSFLVKLSNNEEIIVDNIILAMGNPSSKPILLDIPGAKDNTNISYVAKSYNNYNGKTVIILGGGDSAVDWANNIKLNSENANVTIVHRRDIFRANGENVEVLHINKVNVVLNSTVTKVENNILFTKNNNGETSQITFDEILVQFGTINQGQVDVSLLNNIERHTTKRIITNKNQMTNINGIYAIGNITYYENRPNMIVTAHGEASSAVLDILARLKKYDKHKIA